MSEHEHEYYFPIELLKSTSKQHNINKQITILQTEFNKLKYQLDELEIKIAILVDYNALIENQNKNNTTAV